MERGLIQGWAPPVRLGHPHAHTWAPPGRPRNRRGLGCGGKSGEAEAEPGAAWGGWGGECAVVLLAGSANIWSGLTAGGPWPLGTCRPGGETDSRYKMCNSRGGFWQVRKSFLILVPRGTPSSKEPLQSSMSPEGSGHCSTHPGLLPRHANLGLKRRQKDQTLSASWDWAKLLGHQW